MKYLPPTQQITVHPPRLSISINPPQLKDVTYESAERMHHDIPINTTMCIHATFTPHAAFHYTITKKMNGWSRQVLVIHPKDSQSHSCPFSNVSSSSR